MTVHKLKTVIWLPPPPAAMSGVTETVSNLDWYPTLLAAADVKLPDDVFIRGHSFLPLLQGKALLLVGLLGLAGGVEHYLSR